LSAQVLRRSFTRNAQEEGSTGSCPAPPTTTPGGNKEGVGLYLVLLGWPSAVAVFVVYDWHHLFGSNVAQDIKAVVGVAIAACAAFGFGAMGLAPMVEGYEPTTGSVIAAFVLAFAPTVALALFLYGVV
jgi:hypothetical protein